MRGATCLSCCPTSGPLQGPLYRTPLPVRHIAHHYPLLTLGIRGQVKRRVYARTHAGTAHARAPLPPRPSLSPLPLPPPPLPPSPPNLIPPPPTPPTESAPKTFLPLTSPQTTAFFTSVLSISRFAREPRYSGARTRRPARAALLRSFAEGLTTTGRGPGYIATGSFYILSEHRRLF
jgi:hypothetical protein